MNASGRRTLPGKVPTAFIKKRWKRRVYSQGRIDRRDYALCVMAELRERLRAEDSLPLVIESDFSTFMARKRAVLSDTMARVCARAAERSLPDVTTSFSICRVSRSRLPPSKGHRPRL